MRSKLISLLTALLLVFALAACGGDMNRDNGIGGEQSGSSFEGRNDGIIAGSDDRAAGGSNAVNGQTGMAGADDRTGDDLVDDARDALTGAGDLVEDAMDGVDRKTRQGINFNQMVRNGRVHDRDGDLTDGENSVTPGGATF